jgi:translation initiation factor IF-3
LSKYNNKNKKSNRVFVNRSIRAPRVRCIDQDGNNKGIISTRDAIQLAEGAGLDLIQISYAPRGEAPTCKILDYGKYKYDLSKKEKEQKRKQRESTVKIKEISFRPTTDENDLNTKARQARKFLDNGDQVKLSVRFKKSELRHSDIGFDRLYQLLDIINEETELKYISEPAMSGKFISAIIATDTVAMKQKQAQAV